MAGRALFVVGILWASGRWGASLSGRVNFAGEYPGLARGLASAWAITLRVFNPRKSGVAIRQGSAGQTRFGFCCGARFSQTALRRKGDASSIRAPFLNFVSRRVSFTN